MGSGESSVVVVGAGAAGVLTALRLLDQAEARGRRLEVVLVDPAAEAGRGIAYSTREPTHLLNVPAGRLSADTADPGEFVRWASESLGRTVEPADFLPRHVLGSYLADRLATAAGRCRRARLRRVHDRVIGVERVRGGVTLRLASGDFVSAAAAVLAVGLATPGAAWAPESLRCSPAFVANPWAPGVEYGDEDLLFVGSGLTMVDLALQLDRPHRTMHVVSRTGLLPRRHIPGWTPPKLDGGELTGADGLDAVWRAASAGRGWRAAVDGLRPFTSRIWDELPEAEQGRFIAEKSRYWNCLRHRMAPAAADRLRAIRKAGRLSTHTAEVVAARPDGDGVRVELSCGDVLRVGRVVNCTGPSLDLRACADPLVTALLADGLAEPGPHGLGLDTAADGRLRAAGRTAAPLWTIGAPRVGTLWESTAFPEIREQAGTVATAVLAELADHRRPRPRDRYGLPLTTTPVAAEAFTEGVDRVLRGQHDALNHLLAATEADPGFALGHAVVGLLGLEWGVPVAVEAHAARRAGARRGGRRARAQLRRGRGGPRGGPACRWRGAAGAHPRLPARRARGERRRADHLLRRHHERQRDLGARREPAAGLRRGLVVPEPARLRPPGPGALGRGRRALGPRAHPRARRPGTPCTRARTCSTRPPSTRPGWSGSTTGSARGATRATGGCTSPGTRHCTS